MADRVAGDTLGADGEAPSQDSPVALGLRLVFVAAWLAVLAASLSMAADRRYVWAAAGTTACVITIPLAGRRSWRERSALSAILLCGLIGLAAGVTCYFSLFWLPWFDSFFNDKGTGPLGLIVFALGGATAAGWLAKRFVPRGV